MGQVFQRVLRVSPGRIIPPAIHVIHVPPTLRNFSSLTALLNNTKNTAATKVASLSLGQFAGYPWIVLVVFTFSRPKTRQVDVVVTLFKLSFGKRPVRISDKALAVLSVFVI
jgi:hypothetical protein